MYVAITRARRRLYLSMAQQRILHGQTQYGVLSRFVGEIPADIVHALSAPAKPYAAATLRPQQGIGQSEQQSPEADRQNFHGYRLGQNVRHPKFGTGVIIDAADKGDSARLTINFGKEGIKTLDTAFAKLEQL